MRWMSAKVLLVSAAPKSGTRCCKINNNDGRVSHALMGVLAISNINSCENKGGSFKFEILEIKLLQKLKKKISS